MSKSLNAAVEEAIGNMVRAQEENNMKKIQVIIEMELDENEIANVETPEGGSHHYGRIYQRVENQRE